MAQTVVALFNSANDAQHAVTQLVTNGFSRDSIDISTTQTDAAYTNTDLDTRRSDDNSGSGIGKFFSSLFGGDDDDRTVRNYAEVADLHSVVTVHAATTDEAERAADLLDEYGAIDVDERADEYRTAYSGSVMDTAVTGTAVETDVADTLDTNPDQTVKVIEENLQVGKRTVETGGVRVRSRIVERPVEESLRLREERVRIERNPVNRLATDADLSAFQEGEITLTEHAEVPVVNKEAHVVEEISLGKDVTERDEVIRDTVRSTDVEVEDLGTTGTRLTNTTNITTENRPSNL